MADSTLQQQINEANNQISLLNQKISEYQNQLAKAGTEKKTLQSAIKSLDLQKIKVETQISATQQKIKATELRLKQLGTQITTTKQSIEEYRKNLLTSIKELNQSESQSVLYQLFAADSLAEFWQNIGDNIQLQKSFEENLQNLKSEKATLTNRQTATEQKNKELAQQNKTLLGQKQALAATVKTKNQLLAETKNKESNYQKLLSDAKAQLKSFSDFTKNAGGAKLLSNQTICDSWGCYYNQRDSLWGAQPLNGTEYTLASDGCLVTSVAMVLTHYGYKNITPATINANEDNFAIYYKAFLMKTITAGGITATRIPANIDKTLAVGTPIIAGLKMNSGTHFIVLVSGEDGDYIMHDPYLAGGKALNFSEHYNAKNIYSAEKLVFN